METLSEVRERHKKDTKRNADNQTLSSYLGVWEFTVLNNKVRDKQRADNEGMSNQGSGRQKTKKKIFSATEQEEERVRTSFFFPECGHGQCRKPWSQTVKRKEKKIKTSETYTTACTWCWIWNGNIYLYLAIMNFTKLNSSLSPKTIRVNVTY